MSKVASEEIEKELDALVKAPHRKRDAWLDDLPPKLVMVADAAKRRVQAGEVKPYRMARILENNYEMGASSQTLVRWLKSGGTK